MLERRHSGTVVQEALEKTTESAAPTRIHRALADPRRARIVDELRKGPPGLDAHELAERLGRPPQRLDAFVEPELCIARLRRTAA